jgi:hypothetical protein
VRVFCNGNDCDLHGRRGACKFHASAIQAASSSSLLFCNGTDAVVIAYCKGTQGYPFVQGLSAPYFPQTQAHENAAGAHLLQ